MPTVRYIVPEMTTRPSSGDDNRAGEKQGLIIMMQDGW
jgi:hypothetical protein